MSQIERIDRILEATLNRTADEVGSLLGVEFILTSHENQVLSKQDSFNSLQGKQICAQMDIRGDIEGQGCLLISIKDAIRLGGTLIMLPEAELEEVVSREEYTEEVEDSYGEIANIIAGSFTKDFEEMYPKACRFIRKEQSIIVPLKVDVESNEPVDNQNYYKVSFGMTIDGQPMGDLVMLMPTSTFGLEEEAASAVGPTAETDNSQEQQLQQQPPAGDDESEAVPSPPPTDQVPKFDYDKHKERFNKILRQCQERLEEEVGGLLGVAVTLSDIENRLVTKEDFFMDHTVGDQVVADMEVVGDLEGMSYFVVSKKDAIHLGGVLIMLPPSELEIVVAESDFGEDARDAYGEIANIASGVYTSTFEESYSKKVRFIRKEFDEVTPGKVDIASDDPVENRDYYLSSLSLAIDGNSLGNVHILFPADLFQLLPPDVAQQEAADYSEENESSASATPAASEQESTSQVGIESSEAPQGAPLELPDIDLDKQRTKVDSLLALCQEKMEEEMSSLVGIDVKLHNLDNSIVTKEDFYFDKVAAKQVVADLDVVGEVEGKGYVAVDLRDAIRLGGVLIMLPTSELDSAVSEENFGEDAQDAYGEIANIVAGVYSGVFEEQYTKKIRFIKTVLGEVVPMKVDVESDDPMPNQHYYLSSMDLELDGQRYGKINFLVPLDLFQLQGLVQAAGQTVDVAEEQIVVSESATSVVAPENLSESGSGVGEQSGIDVLLVGDDEVELSNIATTLKDLGFAVKSLSFKDNLHNYLPGQIRAVYLVMKDVNEHVFGTAIKISSTCSLPIVAAGPGWTRSKVIKAVKYGVADILLTPATNADIKENVDNNLTRMAA